MTGLPLRWMMAGEWRAHPSRAVVATLAIAVGVALGFAVHVVNQSALTEFGKAVHAVNGEADLQVHATLPGGVDQSLYPMLAHLPGIGAVSPVVELTALSDDHLLTLLGLDPLRAAAVTPSLLPRPSGGVEAGDRLFDPAAVYFSSAAFAATGRRVGQLVTLSAGGRTADFVIAGSVPGAGDAEAIAVIDIAAAQWRFGQLGRLQRLDLRLAPGAERGATLALLAKTLPRDAEIRTLETEARRSDTLSRAYRVNLEMLAMVALLTGGFLVYSAQSLSVARRQSQFALLRILGLRRRALLAQIVVEGAVVGLAGALLGIGAGFLLADAAIRVLGADLGGGYFREGRPTLRFPPLAAVTLGLAGVGVALAGSLLPALAAGKMQPVVALKNAGEAGDPRHRPRLRWGALLLAAGAAAALAPAWNGLPLFGYLAIGLILAGGVATMPWLARCLLTPLQRMSGGGAVLHLAVARLWGAPMQAAVALCGIVASTSLTIAMAVMVSSFRGSVDDWLMQLLSADLYMRLQYADSGGLDPTLQHRLAAVPGISTIEFRKTLRLLLSAEQPPVALVVRPIAPDDPGRSLPLIGEARRAPAGESPVWISEPMQWLYGLGVGDHLVLPLGSAPPRLFVAGVWRDYSRQFGAVVIEDDVYTRLTGDLLKTEAAIRLADSADPARVMAALRQTLPAALNGQIDIGQPQAIRGEALKIFDRSFAVTYALEAIAIVVGLTGVAATLSAQTLARAKEFGVLRHIGAKRRQIALILVTEGALLGATGLVAGLGLGIVMSEVLIKVVNPQSFHWTMATRLPLGLFALLAVGLIAAAAATAWLAGGRALSADAVRAVREDW